MPSLISKIKNGRIGESIPFLFFFFFFFFFLLFRATPTAYGNSQARGQTRAAAIRLHHQRQIQAMSVTYTTAHGNAGSLTKIEARDQTHIFMDTSQVCYC